MQTCLWPAVGQGCRPATALELGFLKGAAAIKANAPTAVLITVEMAISGCGKARVSAALLAAMEGIAQMGPYTASVLQEAAPPLQQLGPAAGEICFIDASKHSTVRH